MEKKTTIRLAVVVVLLLAIAYLAGAFDRDFTTLDVPELAIDADQIQQIEIAGGDQPMSFDLVNGQWRMAEPVAAKADSNRVARLVREVTSLSLASTASTNPERYDRYGVDSAASRVRVSGDDLNQTFVIGKAGPDFQSIFVRLGDDPNVYGTNGRISVDKDPDRWRDKTVVNLPVPDIERVTVRGDRSFEVSYAQGWQITEGGQTSPADSSAVVSWLRRFSPLRADGFVREIDPMAEEGETLELVFWSAGGSTQSVSLQEHETYLHISHVDFDEVLRVSKGRKSSLVPETTTLRLDE